MEPTVWPGWEQVSTSRAGVWGHKDWGGGGEGWMSKGKSGCHCQNRVEWTLGRPEQLMSSAVWPILMQDIWEQLGPGEAIGSRGSLLLCASTEPPESYMFTCMCVCIFTQVISWEAESRCKFITHLCSALGLLISSPGYKVVEISVLLYLYSSESGLPSLNTQKIWGHMRTSHQRPGLPCVGVWVQQEKGKLG